LAFTKEKLLKKFGWSTLVVSTLLGMVLIYFGTIWSIQFKQNCKGYLKHAADSNTVELAQEELGKAVAYIEANELTEGSTHLFYEMPDRDLGFWYKNLKASLNELETLDSDADQLTVSNHLLKLRETIMDSGEKGTRVTVPRDIHLYPNQFGFRMLVLGSLAGVTIGSILLCIAYEKERLAKCATAKADSGNC
jgi:hypothetical protein